MAASQPLLRSTMRRGGFVPHTALCAQWRAA
jgi:hypothetical protein